MKDTLKLITDLDTVFKGVVVVFVLFILYLVTPALFAVATVLAICTFWGFLALAAFGGVGLIYKKIKDKINM